MTGLAIFLYSWLKWYIQSKSCCC